MTKRGLFGAAAALVPVVTFVAIASAAPQAGDEPRAVRRAGRAGRGGAALAEYLGLTEQQKASWRALHEQRREQMKPILEEGQALRKRLREAVEAPSPDPTAVGEATLALKAHRRKMQAEREAFQAKLEGLLDPAQREKLQAFEAARRTLDTGRDRRRGSRPGRRSPEAPVEG